MVEGQKVNNQRRRRDGVNFAVECLALFYAVALLL